MNAPPITPEERGYLAAELALGLLVGAELEHARTLLAADDGFRAETGAWLGRFGPLLDEVEPREPSVDLWPEIERRLGGTPAANDNVGVLRRRLNLWRGFAGGASALAASLAIVLLTRPAEVAPPVVVEAPAPMIAMLGDEQAGTMLVASWNPASRNLRFAAARAVPADPGRAHELWVIPADGTPRSLGTMPAGPKMEMPVAATMERQLRQGATLAVSVEPPGGSPTGLPTGPVIASGKLERA